METEVLQLYQMTLKLIIRTLLF